MKWSSVEMETHIGATKGKDVAIGAQNAAHRIRALNTILQRKEPE